MAASKRCRSAKIVRLTSATIAIGEPDTGIVSRLQGLLKEAKRGELIGFAYSVVSGANSVRTGWVPGSARADLLISGTAQLAFRVLSAAEEDK